MAYTSYQEIKLVYCYAREDKLLREELEKHLASLKHLYQLTNWYDREILPGQDWGQTIDTHLDTAHLILLLISPDFVASNYCNGKEMGRALERHRAFSCRVVPILLHPTNWEDAPFSHLQLLPTDARPITRWPDRDEAFQDVVAAINRIIEDLPIWPRTAAGWMHEGNLLREEKRYQEALEAYEQANSLDPNFAFAYNNKGNLLLDLERPQEALAAYEQAIRLDPNLASVYHNMGKSLRVLTRYQEALAAYEQAIHLNPNFAIAYYGKGVTLEALGEEQQAQQAHERARQLGYSS